MHPLFHINHGNITCVYSSSRSSLPRYIEPTLRPHPWKARRTTSVHDGGSAFHTPAQRRRCTTSPPQPVTTSASHLGQSPRPVTSSSHCCRGQAPQRDGCMQ
jgi:hypothetical protein